MILKAIYLKIGDLGLPTEYTYGFKKGSRFICHYLERECLKKAKFQVEGFDRVVIALREVPKEGVFVNSAKAACVELGYRREEYEQKSGTELTHYYIDQLRNGLGKMERSYNIPIAELNGCLDEFIDGGCRNEWVHQRKVFRDAAMEAVLACRLDAQKFSLLLTLRRKGETVFEDVILETDPDENAFDYRFKDIELKGDAVVITSKTSEPLKVMCLADLVAR